jgi:tetratricopeptide (TPR) repeat protein
MFRTSSLLVMLLVAAFVVVDARESAQDDAWAKLTSRIDRAVLADDAATLKSCRAESLRLQTAPGGDTRALVAYAIAYIDWRLSFSPAIPQAEQDGLLDEAETQLKTAIKIDAKLAEAHALLSSVYGAKIAKSSIRGIVLGPRSSSAIGQAVQLEPNNPRVLLSQGIGKFNTPAMFGGSETEAEALIRRALAAFQQEPAGKPWPTWGRFEAHAWLGQILAKRGDKAAARSAYEQALAIAPDSGWIRYVLLPSVAK